MSLSSWSQSSPSSALWPTPAKRLVRSTSGLRIVCQQERGRTPWALEEPQWVQDREHHCRRCGHIFCAKCCHAMIQFHRMGFIDPVRICQKCVPDTQREDDFFCRELKALFKGAPFHVRSNMAISSESFLYNCRVSNDERFLLFNNHGDEGEQIPPIDLCRILKADFQGQDQVTITAKEMEGREFSLEIEAPAEPSRKPSQAWLQSFQEGMAMVFNSKEANGLKPTETASPDVTDPLE
eukprot:maker-scaffold340_size202118-snap-gene-1.24 protein:Tk00676 transcript:maker-scaffold340_size202118-snap-gene-1.24-mRNA-1 annotation:"zinc finger fyve domain-containing protein 21"